MSTTTAQTAPMTTKFVLNKLTWLTSRFFLCHADTCRDASSSPRVGPASLIASPAPKDSCHNAKKSPSLPNQHLFVEFERDLCVIYSRDLLFCSFLLLALVEMPVPTPSVEPASLIASPAPQDPSLNANAPLATDVQVGATALSEPSHTATAVEPASQSSGASHPKASNIAEVQSPEISHTVEPQSAPVQAETEPVPMQDTPASSPVKLSPAKPRMSLGLEAAFPTLGAQESELAATPPVTDDSLMQDENPTLATDTPQIELASVDNIDDVISDHVPEQKASIVPTQDAVSHPLSDAATPSHDTSATTSVPPAVSAHAVPVAPLCVSSKEKRVTASPPTNAALRTPSHTQSVAQKAQQTSSTPAEFGAGMF